MKVVATLALLVVALLLWAQTGSGKPITKTRAHPFSVIYDLTTKVEIKEGIRPYAETTYTLYENTPAGRRERWRILQRGKYRNHWISPNGMVWVVTEGMPGPGGGAALWARDVHGNLYSGWNGNHMQKVDPKTKKRVGVSLDPNVAATTAVSLHNGSEQLRFIDKQGNELRLTIADTESGLITFSRIFPAGEPKTDLMTELLDKPYGPAQYELVDSGKIPMAIWTFHNERPNQYLIQTYSGWQDQRLAGVHAVSWERQMSRRPTTVERTQSGKVVWFEFSEPWETPQVATFEVYTQDLAPIKSIDLLEMGKFARAEDARKSVAYRDVLSNVGRGFEPLDSRIGYGAPPRETLRFADRTGRKYQVEISEQDGVYTAAAVASMNLDRVTPKEPIYPDANLASSLTEVSPDGKFTASCRVYERNGRKQGQLTLTANLVDPIEGKKSVQLFSTVVPNSPSEIRVSDSGRVFALSYVTFPSAKEESCFLQCWDPNGRQMGIDLMKSTQWFTSIKDAKARVSLDKMTFEPEGLRMERTIEDVPVQTYPVEGIAFDLGGKTERLYVGFQSEHMPLMFYNQRPKR